MDTTSPGASQPTADATDNQTHGGTADSTADNQTPVTTGASWAAADAAWDASDNRVRDTIRDLFQTIDLPVPENPDIDKWMVLFSAVAQRSSLKSMLPSIKSEFIIYDYGSPPIIPKGTNYLPESATLRENLEHFHDAIHRMFDDPGSVWSQDDVVITPLEWYTARHDNVTRWLGWLDAEASPIVAEVAQDPESGYALLDIPLLQEHLRDVELAYAAQLPRARMREASERPSAA